MTPPRARIEHHLAQIRFLGTSNFLDTPRNSLVTGKVSIPCSFLKALALSNKGRDYLSVRSGSQLPRKAAEDIQAYQAKIVEKGPDMPTCFSKS